MRKLSISLTVLGVALAVAGACVTPLREYPLPVAITSLSLLFAACVFITLAEAKEARIPTALVLVFLLALAGCYDPSQLDTPPTVATDLRTYTVLEIDHVLREYGLGLVEVRVNDVPQDSRPTRFISACHEDMAPGDTVVLKTLLFEYGSRVGRRTLEVVVPVGGCRTHPIEIEGDSLTM